MLNKTKKKRKNDFFAKFNWAAPNAFCSKCMHEHVVFILFAAFDIITVRRGWNLGKFIDPPRSTYLTDSCRVKPTCTKSRPSELFDYQVPPFRHCLSLSVSSLTRSSSFTICLSAGIPNQAKRIVTRQIMTRIQISKT